MLRFYFERSRRYKLFDSEMEHTFLERLAELEKAGLEFRYTYEGYIVCLDEKDTTFPVKEATIRVLTAADFDTDVFPMLSSISASQSYFRRCIGADQEPGKRRQCRFDLGPLS